MQKPRPFRPSRLRPDVPRSPPKRIAFGKLLIRLLSILVLVVCGHLLWNAQNPSQGDEEQDAAGNVARDATGNAAVGGQESKETISFNIDECEHFVIDFGTNVGIQIRKVFEPELYLETKEPERSVLPYYDQYLGNSEQRRKSVCVFGFEPNPVHIARLEALETAYNKKVWRTHIFKAGVSYEDGWANVQSDNDPGSNFYGSKASLKNANVKGERVRMIHASKFMETYVIPRMKKLQKEGRESKLVMKTDIEGEDNYVMQDMITHGSICFIDLVYAEHFSREYIDMINRMVQTFDEKCRRMRIIALDDETHYMSDFPLPN
jgi:hypothetical protein